MPSAQAELEDCPLLDKISAELRNEIWELAFTPDHDQNEEVELFKAKPPRKSLLMTCRQIHNEAKGFYLNAYRAYWPATNFTISFPRTRFSDIAHAHFRGEDVDRIRHFQIFRGGDSRALSYIWNQGMWKIIESPGLRTMLLTHHPITGRIEVDVTREHLPPQSSEPLHKQLLLFIALITYRDAGLKMSPLKYMGYWGSLNQLGRSKDLK
ncbi:hypothetical protein AC578_2861 [Pseudocercospora eumusae]|uniref:Uncharacterized protein n=1 Tax=Pseudocercospora eumusae TaxID=321146 RepID=A0A139H3P2_9PEZI|nr:hypothetical protein AC578_2861 [Pseudocercospora eumusae]